MSKYVAGSNGKCLHCQTVVRFIPSIGADFIDYPGQSETLRLLAAQCPSCGRIIITIGEVKTSQGVGKHIVAHHVVWPLSMGRPPAPPLVPAAIAQDYNEAALVLAFSPKASAALSRRCLQSVLWDAGKTESNNLSQQIDKVLPELPSHIAENLDAVRNIGNFAAHEQKSKSSGMVLDVEPGEAEWNLEVLDSLFDFYYVRPEIERQKREELNKKLTAAGKPPLKEP